MLLSQLLQEVEISKTSFNLEVEKMALDSRQIKKGDVFIAVKGAQSDGRQYISQALASGASVVLMETDIQNEPIRWHNEIPIIPVYQLNQKVALLAARLHDYPGKKLRVFGVTGTNGKTSCSHFIAQILKELQISCGVIGTLGYGFYPNLTQSNLTTPDVVTLQYTLNQLWEKGAKAISMEVSSHSIHQERIYGIDFEVGIFTNLTQDHLDYHGDLESYARVKHDFLANAPIKHIVINADDPYGQKWLRELKGHKSVYAYSTQGPLLSVAGIPCVSAANIQLTLQGIATTIYSPWGQDNLNIPLIGEFNVSNVLAVLSALCLSGIPFKEALQSLSHLQSVPGRMQVMSTKPLIVVDYAHSPDALEKTLLALRRHTQGKLICAFGCGGDRDQGKRPKMAQIVEQFANEIVVTNDNPRHEDPQKIADQICTGFSPKASVTVILDRSKAIEKCIQWADSDDCVLIAGKGAERYQQIGDEKIPFSDAEVIKNVLGRLEKSSGRN